MSPIRSERLELVSISPDFIDALLAERRSDAEATAALKLPDDFERFLFKPIVPGFTYPVSDPKRRSKFQRIRALRFIPATEQ